MAKPPDPFHEFVAELFEPLGDIRIKRMFGGAGIYAHDIMFALIADDTIYLKADDVLKEALISEGSEPFRFKMKDGKVAEMKYYRLPDGAADDPEDATYWGRQALDVALTAKASKRSNGNSSS